MKNIFNKKIKIATGIFSLFLFLYFLKIDFMLYTSSIENLPWYEPAGEKWLIQPFFILKYLLLIVVLKYIINDKYISKINTLLLIPISFYVTSLFFASIIDLAWGLTHREFFLIVEAFGITSIILTLLYFTTLLKDIKFLLKEDIQP